jgi:hypothetical protein
MTAPHKHDDPFSHPLDYVWREDGHHHGPMVAVRKPAGWKDDPAFDDEKFYQDFRAARLLDDQWVGE